MPVHIIADTSARLAGIRAALEKKYAITSELLGGVSVQRGEILALVIKVDLRNLQSICALRKVLDGLGCVEKRIFLLDDAAHLSV